MHVLFSWCKLSARRTRLNTKTTATITTITTHTHFIDLKSFHPLSFIQGEPSSHSSTHLITYAFISISSLSHILTFCITRDVHSPIPTMWFKTHLTCIATSAHNIYYGQGVAIMLHIIEVRLSPFLKHLWTNHSSCLVLLVFPRDNT